MTHNVLGIVEFQFGGHKWHSTDILYHLPSIHGWYVAGMWYVGGHAFKFDEGNTSKLQS